MCLEYFNLSHLLLNASRIKVPTDSPINETAKYQTECTDADALNPYTTKFTKPFVFCRCRKYGDIFKAVISFTYAFRNIRAGKFL